MLAGATARSYYADGNGLACIRTSLIAYSILHVACSLVLRCPFRRTGKETRTCSCSWLRWFISRVRCRQRCPSSAPARPSGVGRRPKLRAFFASLPAAPPALALSGLDGKGATLLPAAACLGQLGGKNVCSTAAPLVVLVSCLPRRLLSSASASDATRWVGSLAPAVFSTSILLDACMNSTVCRCEQSRLTAIPAQMVWPETERAASSVVTHGNTTTYHGIARSSLSIISFCPFLAV